MKKTVAAISVAVMLFTCHTGALAEEPPRAFWDMDKSYQAARNSNDYAGIIKYGNQEIELYRGASDSRQKRDIMVSRYNEVAKAHESLGEWESSARVFDALCEYAEPFGGQYAEILKGARKKSDQYTSEMELYTDSGKHTYYGAKNEKENGVLFGLCSNGETRSSLGNESMVLVYQELGQPLLPYNTNIVSNASAEGIAVELALNCPREAVDINNIRNLTSYLDEISAMLKNYQNIPIYLRFAAEFDVWTDIPDSGSFKDAFRYVSDYFRSRSSNVAIVWSPNQVSNWNVNLDDYYPGDGYVDWVGVSSYAKKYFEDDGGTAEDTLFFKNGVNSEPVIALKEIVEKYGDRKPIMLSESGCGHKVVQTGEDTTDFALRRLREYYSYLPMVYPQIKLIAYFDHYVSGAKEWNDYRLSTNSKLQGEFLRLTKGGRFIQDKYENSVSLCYKQIKDGTYLGNTFLISCYAHKYNNDTQSVTYYIDGKYAGMSEEIPFSTYVNADAYSGQHTLKAVARFADGSAMTREYPVNISAGSDITVKLSGSAMSFDRNPVIYNDRTLVPMRKIFESLNAEVSWDGGTKTVIGKRGDRTVTIAVGNSKMYVNHKQILLDTEPIILSDRTLVPVRAVAEGLGCIVDWDGARHDVLITPRVFEWSEWDTSLPPDIDDDLFYIEKKDEYRTRIRTREKEYYSMTSPGIFSANYVRTDVSYGEWSGWQDRRISENEYLEVDTRTVSIPITYHYYHYCAPGYEAEVSYETEDGENGQRLVWYEPRVDYYLFSSEASYHDLGKFDEPLPAAGDGSGGNVFYNDDGSLYACRNGAHTWYEETEGGGSYTQYRSRPVYYEYIYWQWSNWSEWSPWSDWSEGTPPGLGSLGEDESMDIGSRTLYRYKEK